MSSRTANRTASFSIPLIDEGGAAFVGVSATWELFDARGNIIASDIVPPFAQSDTAVSFEISADDMSLDAGESSSGREIVVYVTVVGGVINEIRDYFVLVSPQSLALMANSFTTYPEALAVRTEFAALHGWDASDRTRQCAALAQAFRNLCKMAYKVPGYNGSIDNQDKAYWGTGTDEGIFWDRGGRRVRVSTLTPDEFDGLPEPFKRALRRAQIAEANILLGGDPIAEKRKSGLISETIGESSSFFDSKPYLNLPISRQAYEEVKRFVHLRIGASRA